MEKNRSELTVRSGNRAICVTGKYASTIALGVFAMLLLFGIAALIDATKNCTNTKNTNS